MNKKSARNIKEFANIIWDENGLTVVAVPGHQNRRYEVQISRNGRIHVECRRADSESVGSCLGNHRTVCYHSIAAIEVVAKEKGHKIVGWCNNREAAKRLARLHPGSTFTRVQSGSGQVWFVGIAKVDKVQEMAKRYILLYNENQNGKGDWLGKEYKSLELEFASRNWNYSMVDRYARTGVNAETEIN